MTIFDCELYRYDAELRYALPRGNVRHRSGVYVRLFSTDRAVHSGAEAGAHGPVEEGSDAGRTTNSGIGCGEIAPLPGFSTETLDEAIEQSLELAGRISGLACDADTHEMFMRDTENLYPSVSCGFELALARLQQDRSAPSCPPWYSSLQRNRVHICALLSGSHGQVADQARECQRLGFRTFKLKVGGCSPEGDIELIHLVRRIIGPDARLRLDANRAWSTEEAAEVLTETACVGIEYVEEPLSDLAGMTELVSVLSSNVGSGVTVPIALDESTDEVLDTVESMEELPWLRALVLKPMIRGGYRRAMRLAGEAVLYGIEPVISSSFESSIGFGGLLAFASSMPGSGLAAGLDTLHYFSAEPETRRVLFSEADIGADSAACRGASAGLVLSRIR